MKSAIINIFKAFKLSIGSFDQKKYDERQFYFQNKKIFEKFRPYTMVGEHTYTDNLFVASMVKNIPGDVVECGVWRGGMIAGIAEVLGNDRKYWLFDSFEGLPAAKEIDGSAALQWQRDTKGEFYYNNCAAEQSYAKEALKLANVYDAELVKGWFSDTLAKATVKKIALLRLDADWYDSTITCLEAFYPKMAEGGIIIIDDYYQWDGCSRAVHDYLSKISATERIRQSKQDVAYIIKNKPINDKIN